jgi:DNA replication protein DnaC
MAVNLSRLGISSDFTAKSWNDIQKLKVLSEEEKAAYSSIYKDAKNWGKAITEGNTEIGLHLYGANGSGKSTLGCLLLLGFLKREISCLRVTMIKIQQEFYKEWRIPEFALFRGVLFIDEVGKEYHTKQEHSEIVFEYVMKHRSERLLPTILASNADIDFLYKRYGETVNSILRGKFMLLDFPEVDLRQRLVGGKINEILGYENGKEEI